MHAFKKKVFNYTYKSGQMAKNRANPKLKIIFFRSVSKKKNDFFNIVGDEALIRAFRKRILR